LPIKSSLSGNEYRFMRLLRALGNENRFILFKNLQKGQCYATELSNVLKISRPALGKHVGILIGEGLVEQNHVIEHGAAKAVYELSSLGESIAKKMNMLTDDIESITAQIVKEMREELMDINAQINGSKNVLKELERKLDKKEISNQDYESLKAEYNKSLDELKVRKLELENNL